MQVGFIGLGIMGASMASNLQKAGYKLVVHDLQRQNAGAHIAAGAQWAATPKAVAEACEVVFTSLPGPAEFEAVALGKDGLAEGFKKGSALFDLTTNAPERWSGKTQQAYAEKGIHLLDAPVSGGPAGAKSGRLAIWVGGDKAIFDKYKKELDAIGDAARYIGPIGAGSVAKLVHNCAGYAIQTALGGGVLHGDQRGRRAAGPVGGGAQRCRRALSHLRPAGRSLPRQLVRPAELRAEARAQGHAARHRARPRAGRADAPRQSRLCRADRSAQSRLGEPRQPLAHAAPARAGGAERSKSTRSASRRCWTAIRRSAATTPSAGKWLSSRNSRVRISGTQERQPPSSEALGPGYFAAREIPGRQRKRSRRCASPYSTSRSPSSDRPHGDLDPRHHRARPALRGAGLRPLLGVRAPQQRDYRRHRARRS